MRLIPASISLLLLVFTLSPVCRSDAMDLTIPSDNLTAFVKARGSLAPEDVVFHWEANVWSFVPDQRSKLLFRFEGYNISRMVKADSGYLLLTREMGVYKDPATGQVLERWQNPFTGREVPVVHVWNDPVNQKVLLESRHFKFPLPHQVINSDAVFFIELPLTYPSPLPRSKYPDNGQSEMYQSVELFQVSARMRDLENKRIASAPAQMTWTRIGQWLPWMGMGDKPGYLVYHTRARKLPNGFAGLPKSLSDFVLLNHAEYAKAPKVYTEPNETSWTYYKKLLADTARAREK